MKLYLVRHGQTSHNAEGLGLGRADVPLTSLGLQQAQALGRRFADEGFEAIFASPLSRAHDTALPLSEATGVPIQTTEALIELDVGETEHLTYPTMREQYPAFIQEWTGPSPHTACMPGGETLQQLADRLQPFLANLLDSGCERVALFTHNFTVKIAICLLLDLPLPRFRQFGVDLASVSVYNAAGPRSALERLNDRCHLETLEP